MDKTKIDDGLGDEIVDYLDMMHQEPAYNQNIREHREKMSKSKGCEIVDTIGGVIILSAGSLFVIYIVYILFFDPTSNLLRVALNGQ